MRKCFIHIGTHKTGTTSIQHLLTHSNSALQERGYFYPQAGRLETLPGHHNLAWEISGDHRFQNHYGTIDELIREVKQRSEDIILSSEDFESSVHHRSEFSHFISILQSCGFLVTVILYVRNQIDYLPRMYLTHLYSGLDLSFENFLGPTLETAEFRWREQINNLDYSDLLNRINEIANVNVIVRSYEQARTAICSDFLSILNLRLPDLQVDDEILENVTLPLSFYLQTFLENRLGRTLFENEANAVSGLVSHKADKIELSPRVRSDLFQRLRETNRNLFIQYGIPEPKMENGAQDHPDQPYIDKLFTENIESSLLQALSTQLAERHEVVQLLSTEVAVKGEGIQSLSTQVEARDRAIQSLSTEVAEKHGIVQGLSTQLAEKDELLQGLSTQLAEKGELVQRLSTELAEQIRALQSRAISAEERFAVLSAQLLDTQTRLKKITDTLGWRLLSHYGRIKYGVLLPIYRLFGKGHTD